MEEDQEAALVNQHIRTGLPSASPAAAEPSSSKRKRRESAIDDRALKKSRADKPTSTEALNHPKTSSGKLQRPTKLGQQESAFLRPTKAKGDIYEVPEDANDERAIASEKPKGPTRRKVGRPKGRARPATPQKTNLANPNKTPKNPRGRQKTASAENSSLTDGIKPHQQGPDVQLKTKLLSRKTTVNGQRESEHERSSDEPEQERQPPAEEDGSVESKDDQIVHQGGEYLSDSPRRKSSGQRQNQETIDVTAPSVGNEAEGAQQARKQKHRPKSDDKMLLGHDYIWSSILEAVRANRQVAVCDKTIMTNTIKELVSAIKVTRRAYREIEERSSQNEPILDLEEEINANLNDLDELVRKLSAKDAQKRIREMVKDIYLHAAPQSVFLLKYAMRCRVLENSKKAYNLNGLREIVRIQNITVSLCNKVAAWGVKPVTNAPITRNVKQRIFPYMREMATAFKKKLVTEEQRERRRQNEKQYASQRAESETPSPERRARRAAEREAENRRMLESMEEERGKLKRYQRRRAEDLVPSSRASQTRQSQTPALAQEKRTQNTNLRYPNPQPGRIWTTDEDKALIQQLLNNVQTRKLPGKSHQ